MEITSTCVLEITNYCCLGSLEQKLDGGSGKMINENVRKKFYTQELKYYTYGILHGLHHLEQNKKTHGHLIPSNIIIGNDGIIKLSDFYINPFIESTSLFENILERQNRYTNLNILQKNNDIWSLGVILLDLTFGKDCLSDNEISKITPKKVKSLFQYDSFYSNEMSQFISQCFEIKTKRPKIIELLESLWISKKNLTFRVFQKL